MPHRVFQSLWSSTVDHPHFLVPAHSYPRPCFFSPKSGMLLCPTPYRGHCVTWQSASLGSIKALGKAFRFLHVLPKEWSDFTLVAHGIPRINRLCFLRWVLLIDFFLSAPKERSCKQGSLYSRWQRSKSGLNIDIQFVCFPILQSKWASSLEWCSVL